MMFCEKYDNVLKNKSLVNNSLLVENNWVQKEESTSVIETISDNLRLVIGHVNDTHSHFYPEEIQLKVNDEKVYGSIGGFPRCYQAVMEQKTRIESQQKPYLFFHAGDAFQGHAFFKVNKGHMNADLLSQLPMNAMVLGNHEFDLNNRLLSQFINDVSFPIVSTNIDVSEDVHLNHCNIFPYVLFEKINGKMMHVSNIDKVKNKYNTVAVIGIILEDMNKISTNVDKVKTFNEIDYAKKITQHLKSLGICNIIALTHIGLDRDIRLAKAVPDIGLIVGGHTHTLLGDFTDLGLKYEGAYPVVIQHSEQQKTYIVQSGSHFAALGEIELEFNRDGTVSSCQGENRLLLDNVFYMSPLRHSVNMLITHKSQKLLAYLKKKHILFYQENPSMRSYIDKYYLPDVLRAYGEVIAKVPKYIEHVRLPTEAHSDKHGSRVAPLVAQAFLAWTNSKEVLEKTNMPSQIALVTASTARNSIEPTSEYRQGHVSLELLPFTNCLSIVTLSGAQIRTLLEFIIERVLPKNVHTGKFPYVGGLRYTYVEEVAYQSGKLTELEVLEKNELGEMVWNDIQLDKKYNVVTTSFTADGNDGVDYMYMIQKENTNRKDLIFYQNKLKSIDVLYVNKDTSGYKAIYKDGFSLQDDDVDASTDSFAFLYYVKKHMPILKEMNTTLVNFEIAKQREESYKQQNIATKDSDFIDNEKLVNEYEMV